MVPFVSITVTSATILKDGGARGQRAAHQQQRDESPTVLVAGGPAAQRRPAITSPGLQIATIFSHRSREVMINCIRLDRAFSQPWSALRASRRHMHRTSRRPCRLGWGAHCSWSPLHCWRPRQWGWPQLRWCRQTFSARP